MNILELSSSIENETQLTFLNLLPEGQLVLPLGLKKSKYKSAVK